MDEGLWHRFMPGVAGHYLAIGVIIGFIAGLLVGVTVACLAWTYVL